MDLVLEVRDQENATTDLLVGGVVVSWTPPIDEDYWAFRVKVSETQAIVGFPKFSTFGIGFAQEEDWNTNLPYTVDAEEIYRHIARNKGDDAISEDDCLAAIRLIQAVARQVKQRERAG